MPDPGGPRYKHDCEVVGQPRTDVGDEGVTARVSPFEDACRFVGRLREYDLYIHIRDYTVECVARHGDDGPDYLSGPSVARMIGEFIGDG